MRSKGQLQTLEPIIITIFLVFILGILLMLYMRMGAMQGAQSARVQENAQDLAVLKAMAKLPEIACSRAETGQTYCIDRYKAEAFADRMTTPRNQIPYYALFGESRITISITDMNGNTESIMIYNNTGSNVRPSIMYTTVYDPLEESGRRRKFAMIMIERGTS